MDDRAPPMHLRLLRRVLTQPVTTVADAVVPVVVDAVDLNDAVSRIEVNEIVDKVDVNELLGRVDLDALLARIDVDAVLSRVDVDALLARVDVDAVLARVDVERVIERVQLEALVHRTTGGLLRSFLDLLRRQVVGLDVVVMGLLDRLRRRRARAIPAGPGLLRRDGLAAGEVSGRYAGPASRLVAFGLDIAVVLIVFGVASALVTFLVELVFGYHLVKGNGTWWSVAYFSWWFVYLWASLAIAGRTVGKLVTGLRVVAADGHPLTPRRALVRTAVFPLSFAFFFFGFVLALFQAQRRALHDLLAGTAEVYDWGDRPAQLPSPLTWWLSRRGALQGDGRPPPPPPDGGSPAAPSRDPRPDPWL